MDSLGERFINCDHVYELFVKLDITQFHYCFDMDVRETCTEGVYIHVLYIDRIEI